MMDPVPSQGSAGAARDIAPLSWVVGEIRAALGHAADDAASFFASATQVDDLRSAIRQLHEVAGALHVLDLRGPALVLDAAESLCQQWEGRPEQCLPGPLRMFQTALAAVRSYLDTLVIGGDIAPIRLYPYYRDLLHLLGATRISPADLLFPDLNRDPPEDHVEVRHFDLEELVSRRNLFEDGLARFLRDSGDAAGRSRMRAAVADLETQALPVSARHFWWVARALVDALDQSHVPVDNDLKRFLARLNQQMRRHINGGPAVAERLYIDALFHIARSDRSDQRVRQAQEIFGLDTLVPADYEQPRLSTSNAEALTRLRESLLQAKLMWGQLAASDSPQPDPFLDNLESARSSAQLLGLEDAVRLIAAIQRNMSRFVVADAGTRESAGIEIATGLLLLESSAQWHPHVDPEFGRQATAMIERIDLACSSEAPPEAGQWLTDLSRRAQERSSLAAAVAEMRALLRDAEMRLDRFFRHPDHREELPDLEPILDQVGGVLSVLGHDDAATALRLVRDGVSRYIDPAVAADPAEFTRIAHNIGAIGFFINELGLDAGQLRSHFHFNSGAGIFEADLGLRLPKAGNAADEVTSAAEADPRLHAGTYDDGSARSAADGGRPGNVEQDLRQALAQAYAIASALPPEPIAEANDAQLGDLLARLATDAELLDDAGLRERIAQAVRHLDEWRLGAGTSALLALIDQLRPDQAPLPEPTAPLPESPGAADQELHDIFVEEASEVLDDIDTQTASLLLTPGDLDRITLVRRGFHTLKGSSRMVGLAEFGEFAWSLEQCFNLWLSQERPASPALLDLAQRSAARLRQWVGLLGTDPRAVVEASDLISEANRLRDLAGEPAPEPDPAAAPNEDDVRRIGPLVLSHALYSIFLNESDECVRALAQDIGEWRYESERPVAPASLRVSHTLAGISRTVGLTPVSDLTEPLDDVLRQLNDTQAPAPHLTATQFDVLERVIERIRGMLHRFAAGEYPPEAGLEVQALRDLLTELCARTTGIEADPGVAAVEAFATAPAANDPGQDPAPYAQAVSGPVEAAATDPFATASVPEPMPTGHDQTPVAQAFVTPDAAYGLTDGLADSGEPLPASAAPEVAANVDPAPAALELVHGANSLAAPGPEATTVRDDIDPQLFEIFSLEAQDLLPTVAGLLRDLHDPQRQEGAASEIMRQLHTLKGSARMAGAMRLGEQVHELETRVESAVQSGSISSVTVDDLQSHFDQILASFDAISAAPAPVPAPAPAPAFPGPVTFPVQLEPLADQNGGTPAAPGARPAASEVPVSFIRVRSDVVDRLVDHAGEISITRAKLESEIGILRSSLSDLAENIQRLRSQLREVELQADAQVQARSDQVAKQATDFDPLEFDRYSRLQELTRLMAESVEDVALVQSNMFKGLQLADDDVSAQSRLTRELQQYLMRVRLVPFSHLSERLYRVARQTAKELQKRVNLDLSGTQTEVDRSLLEQMAGPFEHLLRNAIVHGLETQSGRAAAGKTDIGQLRIEARREGSEIVVVFSDDGAGLDLERIRQRAVESGIVPADRRLDERETIDLIFAPGLSTADEITELAGRGIGMDAVRAQVSSLGGRIAVSTEAGKGTRFTLYMPMSLSMMQVVLATVGGQRYAVPAAMVESARRIRARELHRALQLGSLFYADIGDVTLRSMAQLLGANSSPLPCCAWATTAWRSAPTNSRPTRRWWSRVSAHRWRVWPAYLVPRCWATDRWC